MSPKTTNASASPRGSRPSLIVATCHLESISAYSQSKRHKSVPDSEKNEGQDAFDERCWREHLHVDSDGSIYIPQMAFKKSLDAAAMLLGTKIPGKGSKTYAKDFISGVLVMDSLVLPITPEEVECEAYYMDSNPSQKNRGSRVLRRYPVIPSWAGEVKYHITSKAITEEVFRDHLFTSGSLIGIGRFRPEKGGFYGRFQATSIDWGSL